MRPQLKIEKLPLHDDCEDSGVLKETELSQLSFWSEPQQNFLPEWGHFQNRLNHFKVAGIALGVILFCLSGYFIFRCFSGPSIAAPELCLQPKVKIIPAPALPHKIKVTQEKESQDHAVYHRHETVQEETKVLEDDEETELTAMHEEDLPYTTPAKKAQPSKKTSSLGPLPTAGQPTCVVDGSYYIEIGLFDSHQLALDTWCNLKKDPAKTRSLHEVEPLVEIVGTTHGEQYRLLAGPVTYKEGRLKTQILNSKGYNMKLVGRNN